MLGITDNQLERCRAADVDSLEPGAATSIARALGPLGRWWLRPELLVRATEECPEFAGPRGWNRHDQLPQTRRGAAAPLFVQPGEQGYPLLRKAFVLPLIWRRGTAHSPYLPHGLSAIADAVLDATGQRDQSGDRAWGLHLSEVEGLAEVDLSAIRLKCESAFVPLAASLILATQGLTPVSDVWSSGCWNARYGITEVEPETRDAKVNLARSYGAALHMAASPGEGFEPISLGGSNVRRQLDQLLAKLVSQPDPGDAEGSRVYYLTVSAGDRERAEDYYCGTLIKHVIERHGELHDTPDHAALVTVASNSPELAVLGLRLTGQRQLLLAHTRDESGGRFLRRARRLCNEHVPDCDVVPIPCDDSHPRALAQELKTSLADWRQRPLLFDLTAGNKLFSIAFIRIARPADRCLYLRHRMVGPKPDPWTLEAIVEPGEDVRPSAPLA